MRRRRRRAESTIAPAWRRAWSEVIPFFAFDPAIRKIIYTTNAIESLNRVIRKSIKTRGSFPTEEAATMLIYLASAASKKAAGTFGNGLPPAINWLSCSRIASPRDRI
ncbi:Transposase, Mutator family [Palleronia marisminoris]|uniref:Mutator family transposase n=1 Tax=Palleronia marisminoris TaxID=315423 RepID=A0A1Y5TT27_9RHOB|nr:Transposase, Mutator family [Palleronia marisminoris]SLN71417.1 Transposase, Mutator family [Palleronia marisminoris]